MTIKELNKKRTALFEQISNMRDAFNKNGQAWSDPEGSKKWDAVNAEYDATMDALEVNQRGETLDRRNECYDQPAQHRPGRRRRRPRRQPPRPRWPQQRPGTKCGPRVCRLEKRKKNSAIRPRRFDGRGVGEAKA